jgi:cytidine deaminase
MADPSDNPPLSADERELARHARRAQAGAVCSFSNFAVGVAIRCADGSVVTGANVENASYNLGLCAERVALYYALTHHIGPFETIAIATDADLPTLPCGACRQALWEFAPKAAIVSVAASDRFTRTTVASLLPSPFDAASLRSS